MGNSMFSPTVREENSAPCWNRMPQRRSISWRCISPASSRLTPKTSIRPCFFGNKPRMVRVSTDLPAPEAPTNPRISPRYTSSVTPLRIRWPLRSTIRSRTSITGVFEFVAISHSDGGEEHGKNAVEDNDEKDRLDHRIGRLLAERFGAALNLQPLHARDNADDERHEWRLDHADFERVDRNGCAQARQKDFLLD